MFAVFDRVGAGVWLCVAPNGTGMNCVGVTEALGGGGVCDGVRVELGDEPSEREGYAVCDADAVGDAVRVRLAVVDALGVMLGVWDGDGVPDAVTVVLGVGSRQLQRALESLHWPRQLQPDVHDAV